jgi:5-methylcytosine-specific restriction protein A
MPAHKNPQLIPAERRYFTQAWHKKAAAQLRREPLCRMCAQKGLVVAATVADHLLGHRDGESWDEFILAPLQSLCASCHSRLKQGIERRGFDTTIGADGWPTDPAHPTNVRARQQQGE